MCLRTLSLIDPVFYDWDKPYVGLYALYGLVMVTDGLDYAAAKIQARRLKKKRCQSHDKKNNSGMMLSLNYQVMTEIKVYLETFLNFVSSHFLSNPWSTCYASIRK